MIESIKFHPDSASTFAGSVDLLFYALVGFSFALGLFLTIMVVTYAFKYRRGSPADRSGRIRRTLPIEIAWTSLSLLAAFGLFGWGARLYVEERKPPADAMQVIGIGKQWMWKFEHEGGQREIDALHVPVNRPVVVQLGSQDVIHSFYVPAFRVKQDAVPGMTTRVWFEATKPGTYHLFCAEFCGTEHSRMKGKVVVLSQQDYADWLGRQPQGEGLVEAGEKLFRSLGCSGCHEGSSKVRAPNLQGVFGRPVALSDGRTVIADRAYIHDSILMPKKDVAAGYEPVMPSFDGVITESELLKIIAYIESL